MLGSKLLLRRTVSVQLQELINLVRLQGGYVHRKVAISDHPINGLHLISTCKILAGTKLIELPNQLVFHWSTCFENHSSDSVLHRLAEVVPEEICAMRLALRILHEKEKKYSYWQPYIRSFPVTSTPLIQNVHCDPLHLLQVQKMKHFILDFTKQVNGILKGVPIKNHPFEGRNLSPDELAWAYAAVCCRFFPLHGANIEPMLLPLIDICNHSVVPNATLIPNNRNLSFKLIAENNIEENTAITLNYGCNDNDLLFSLHGRTLPSNLYDSIILPYDCTLLEAASLAAGISSSSFSDAAVWQKEILSLLNLHGDKLPEVKLGGSELIDPQFLAIVRVFLSSDEKAVKRHNLNSLMALGDVSKPPLGSLIERLALTTIIELCRILLQRQMLTNKIEDTEAILKTNVSRAVRLDVLYQIQKKMVIVDVIRRLAERVKMLPKEKMNN